ncbi:3-deoxy-manno-octulosonate cytidylyltransferase [Capnocytophaga catalasegens]|uniref:3-deoxy-manno-octulosonate cytidylyltransferase n=1 Tax=Capnocytophaga catalasegens TaxID=1004260 RepID=A0AAV5AY48_9FLAO|nr:3-deoxy-manno-octulosonate cytidylyltransferase [Capnocytophaga catalasegens]GIZ15945.1 3-deoxy-manno-octulosonate cytidylyltransferase [Capnocytophaga catalasegens]GJM50432.1 3-deoxy-manno-octulosonate cytidylyltransferase [Capnocytophaga catalasegens]GJM53927.1 3-deoxy-manno-octulosonate cytidylyltransferase [Capnocytophaga catalasegens]
MKKIAIIPARYGATRFPAKLMQDLAGKPVIVQTYLATIQTQLFDNVYVVTDSDIIKQAVEDNGGKAILSQKEHVCGSDRIAEAAKQIDAEIIVNVQGDEPFIERESLQNLLGVFENDTQQQIDLASLMTPLSNYEEVQNPNNVKVITDVNNFALYFSRSVIPFMRDENIDFPYMKHIGVYAFRKQALMDFYNLPMRLLEASEKLEQLRYLEYGKRIKMVITNKPNIGIDTYEDLQKARLLWEK